MAGPPGLGSQMLGAGLIILCACLWATDAIFRLPLAGRIDASTIVLFEHMICVAVTLPWFLVRRAEVSRLGARGWAALAFVGMIGSALGTYCFTASYQHINPSVTILLQKMQPIFAVLGGRFILGERPKRGFYGWAGVALIAATMISVPELWRMDEILAAFPSLRSGNTNRNLGILLATSAAAAWGLSTVFGKWAGDKLTFPVTAFLRFALGLVGLAFLVGLRVWQAPSNSPDLSAADIQAMAYMGLVPGALAMYLYYAGLRRTRASVATFAEMFFPVAAIAINWNVLGQPLLPPQIIGAVLLMIAVYFINKTSK